MLSFNLRLSTPLARESNPFHAVAVCTLYKAVVIASLVVEQCSVVCGFQQCLL